MKKIKVTIEGMHCASCGSNVESSVSKVKGIESVRVSVMTNKAIIEAEDSIDIGAIKDAISKVGYKIVKVE